MNLTRIQRHAFIAALLTLFGVMAAVLCYWQAVAKGVLPSPVQPLAGNPPKTAAPPAAVEARELPAAGQPSVQRKAAEDSTPPGPPDLSNAAFPLASPPPSREEQPSSANLWTDPALSRPVLAPVAVSPQEENGGPESSSHKKSDQDEVQARHWLSHTNDRPLIRVHYDTGDILQLAEAGRGTIIARGRREASRREVYLLAKRDSPPLFLPYTPAVASQFSPYDLLLDPSPLLAPVLAGLPAYFPDADCDLSFVPDHPLALDIFTQVATAARSFPESSRINHRVVVEGELTLHGTKPSFRVLGIQSVGEHADISTAPEAAGQKSGLVDP
jgi:hypothetical protein